MMAKLGIPGYSPVGDVTFLNRCHPMMYGAGALPGSRPSAAAPVVPMQPAPALPTGGASGAYAEARAHIAKMGLTAEGLELWVKKMRSKTGSRTYFATWMKEKAKNRAIAEILAPQLYALHIGETGLTRDQLLKWVSSVAAKNNMSPAEFGALWVQSSPKQWAVARQLAPEFLQGTGLGALEFNTQTLLIGAALILGGVLLFGKKGGRPRRRTVTTTF